MPDLYIIRTCSSNVIEKATNKVIALSKNYYVSRGYENEVEDVSVHSEFDNFNQKNSFVSSLVQSEDLVNAGHLDINDSSVSMSTWTELQIGVARKWYFLMPNITRDKVRGIAVVLQHGTTIRWDGSKIFHCSTVGDVGRNKHVYGTFYGTRGNKKKDNK